MKILAVDTTAAGCSVALVDGQRILAEQSILKRETHSKHLLTCIDSVLNSSGFDVLQVDGFAVAKGPGSFTGLRIGISTIKGLAVATGKPVAGVSSLLSLACGVPVCDEIICVILDARKGEVYQAFFKYINNDIVRLSDETVINPEELIDQIKEKTVFVGSGLDVYRDLIVERVDEYAVFLNEKFNTINAANIANLGAYIINNSENEHVADITPQYIRKSDAEINLKAT